MPLHIYTLTPVGTRISKNTQNPDTLPYKILSFLAFNGASSAEQITNNIVINNGEQPTYGEVRTELIKLETLGAIKNLRDISESEVLV